MYAIYFYKFAGCEIIGSKLLGDFYPPPYWPSLPAQAQTLMQFSFTILRCSSVSYHST